MCVIHVGDVSGRWEIFLGDVYGEHVGTSPIMSGPSMVSSRKTSS